MKKPSKFRVVKHLKSLSRATSKTPPVKVVRSRKQDLLRKISKQEMKDLE